MTSLRPKQAAAFSTPILSFPQFHPLSYSVYIRLRKSIHYWHHCIICDNLELFVFTILCQHTSSPPPVLFSNETIYSLQQYSLNILNIWFNLLPFNCANKVRRKELNGIRVRYHAKKLLNIKYTLSNKY